MNGNGGRLERLAENSLAKFVARYVVPLCLALGAWLGPRYIDGIVDGLQKQINQNVASLDILRDELRSGRERNIAIALETTKALAEVQRSAAALAATADARYQELKGLADDSRRRIERTEDRLGGGSR